MNQHQHVEYVFRHEYGQLVALLLRRVGVLHLEAVEDAVQEAMMKAMDSWRRGTIPDNPSAWLYTVAYRQLMSELRGVQQRQKLLSAYGEFEQSQSVEQPEVPLPGEMNDALLRMLFVASDNTLAVESQLVFTLKCLCGFSVREISLRLFISEANVYKRMSRARKILQSKTVDLDALAGSEMIKRLPMVHKVLYLLFTEGYLSSQADSAIRQDLCDEAIRLALILSHSTVGNVAETSALLALMYFHMSRINTRQDESGALLLLEYQDRSKWNKELVKTGMQYLERSAQGETLSRYHIEASIAAEHCMAPTYEQTRWDKIVQAYELLEHSAHTVLHRLNWAIAMAQWKGPEAGLAVLKSKDFPMWLERSYHWHAVMADLQYQSGQRVPARKSAELAIQAAPTQRIKQLLQKRLAKYDD